MRKIVYTNVLVILLLNTLHSATITVDNNPPYAGQYQNLQEAHDNASTGDSIYVFPSMVPYNAITVTKQLYFLGVGFNITENIGEPFTPVVSISGVMSFHGGSEGSLLEGFGGNFKVGIVVSNIIIKRNKVTDIFIGDGYGIAIIQNKIHALGNDPAININYIVTGVLISSNKISGTIGINNGENHEIRNNVLDCNYPLHYLDNSLVVNNIFLRGIFHECFNNVYLYNMSNSTQLPEGNGNIRNVDMITVFVDSGNDDFHLLIDSPARGSGENGADMGIYGGDAPYIDGGFPGLPSILQILAPTVGSQQSGLNIQFKAKTNNE